MIKFISISSFLFISLVLSINLCYSQNRITSKVLLNSEEVFFNDIFVRPNNLKSITVDNKSDTQKIFITTRKYPWKYRSLESILKESDLYTQIKPAQDEKKYFRVDGQIVRDISTIKIDAQYKPIVTVEHKTTEGKIEININIWLTKKDYRKFQKTNQYPIYIRGFNIRF